MMNLFQFGIALGLAVALGPFCAHAEDTQSFTLGAAAAADALDTMRAGTDTTYNDMRLQGTSAGNSAENIATGNNSIGGGSFAGFSGIPLVVQNSGANVVIQNAVIVNVKMQ